MPTYQDALFEQQLMSPITDPLATGVFQNAFALGAPYHAVRGTQTPLVDQNFGKSGRIAANHITVNTIVDNAYLTVASYMPSQPIYMGSVESPQVGSVDASMLDMTVAGPTMMPYKRDMFTGDQSYAALTNYLYQSPATLGLGANNLTASNMYMLGMRNQSYRPGATKYERDTLAFNSRSTNLDLVKQARMRLRAAQANQTISLVE